MEYSAMTCAGAKAVASSVKKKPSVGSMSASTRRQCCSDTKRGSAPLSMAPSGPRNAPISSSASPSAASAAATAAPPESKPPEAAAWPLERTAWLSASVYASNVYSPPVDTFWMEMLLGASMTCSARVTSSPKQKKSCLPPITSTTSSPVRAHTSSTGAAPAAATSASRSTAACRRSSLPSMRLSESAFSAARLCMARARRALLKAAS
mmetsp:Transcript_627/g.2098  ORF Transcript_627/g.2098 Transcript_627/m.2098 type:complete len:208 (-) Transcript_627:1388-2011(-)